MLAKTTLVALTTALALLTASLGPTPATALPIADNNSNNSENDNNDHVSDIYSEFEYEPVPSFVPPTRTTTRPPGIPHFNLPIPAPSPSPSRYRYYGDYDYASYDGPGKPMTMTRATPTTSVWDGIATGWYYPTVRSGGGGGQAVPTWTTRATRPSDPPKETPMPDFVRTNTHWYGHGDGAVYSRTMSTGGNNPPPMYTRTPYRYNGGNNGGAQQRPFGVDQQNSTWSEGEFVPNNDNNDEYTSVKNEYDEYVHNPSVVPFAPRPTSTFPPPSDEIDMAMEVCRPSGEVKRYIGVDLRENSFAVGYVNSEGKTVLIPNERGELYSPLTLCFLDGGRQALVGFAALHLELDQGLTTEQVEASVVDLSSLKESYETFPQNELLSLERDRAKGGDRVTWYKPGKYHEHLLAVLLKRAIDMAERHESFSSSGEKVHGIAMTIQHPSNDAEGASGMDGGYMDDRSIEMSHAENVMPTKMIDAYPETLSLAAAHIEFFESRVQRDPLGGEDAYLPQTVLFYNLRDTTEDMTLMQYQKGTFGLRPFHLKALGGYLEHNEGRIQDKFESYLIKSLVHHFNQILIRTREAEPLLEDNEMQHVDKAEFYQLVFLMENLSKWYSNTDEDKFITTEVKLGPHSMTLSLSMYKEIRFEFLKERLSKAVDRVLASSGLESKDMVDHLVVADVTSFKGQSTAAMEAVFGEEGEKKIVKAVDPKRAVAEGIVTVAGLLTKESPLQVPWYCPGHQQ
ncbi:hypothetical protein F5H01DRAFT_79136 [Linnemannia elongata]|nr:hypothetical protein F5H01DRAFT_79136 [Linnemannia elongata]